MRVKTCFRGLIILLAALWVSSAWGDGETAVQQTAGYRFPITGRVYEDRNENSLLDPSEPGVAGVGVTDGSEVVLADGEGRYRLSNAGGEARIV